MRHAFSAAAALVATFSLNALAASIPTCDPENHCSEDAPCCSQYGQCGTGAYCLGGCDPMSSFSLQSCMPAPLCKSEDYKLDSLDDVQMNTDYLGDTDGVNWVASGQPVVYQKESVLLTMAPSTVGTLLMSTHYVWYGKISATLTTSQGQGVVTAFIMMSDVKDEIDFEFVGVDIEQVQSNYYWEGVTDYTNSKNISVTNTVENEHTYTFDWQPDQLTWAVDGQTYRTLKKSDTWNDTDNKYHYPQTPARVQLSLWPAGLPSNGQGTINWAGGLINWDSPYMQNGYFYAQMKEVSVECYDPPSGTKKDGDKSYYYTNREGLQKDVAIGDKSTELASFDATGDNPGADPSGSADQPKNTAETVPGLSGGGERGFANGGASASGPAGSVPTDSSTSFVQGSGSSDASTVMAGSAVALLGFFVAVLLI